MPRDPGMRRSAGWPPGGGSAPSRAVAAAAGGRVLVATAECSPDLFLYVVMYFGRKNFDSVKKSMGAELALTTSSGTSTRPSSWPTPQGSSASGRSGTSMGPADACRVVDRRRRRVCVDVDGCHVPRRGAGLGCERVLSAMGFPLVIGARTWFTSEQRGTVLGFWTTSLQVGGTLATTFSGFVAAGGITSESDFSLLCIRCRVTWRDAFPARGVLSSDGARSTILAGGIPRDCRPQACRFINVPRLSGRLPQQIFFSTEEWILGVLASLLNVEHLLLHQVSAIHYAQVAILLHVEVWGWMSRQRPTCRLCSTWVACSGAHAGKIARRYFNSNRSCCPHALCRDRSQRAWFLFRLECHGAGRSHAIVRVHGRRTRLSTWRCCLRRRVRACRLRKQRIDHCRESPTAWAASAQSCLARCLCSSRTGTAGRESLRQ